MTPFGRRDFLKAAALLAASTAGCGLVAASEELKVERVALSLPGLDPSHDGLRVAQLSDVHVGPLTPPERIRAAIEAANGFAPDLVVLTGDYLSYYYRLRRHSSPRLITEQLDGLHAPVVAILGNHDYYSDAAGAVTALERLGYGVLRNENTTLTLRGAPFTVVGIDDLSTHHAEPARAVRGAAPGSRLYLAHVPVTARMLQCERHPLLVLSGHTHGGQLNFPPFSMLQPYNSGLYRLGDVQLYVSRGLGNSWFPLRVNAPPEVTLLTLRAAPA
ncbi:MAG TPA: metallophosphoesterase [Anaeromyxobacteraceae bacterium]|jgi:hypothetical protein|nr:metallophosphoesterase [Anaeromyxobacteraceae bacterium]